MPLKKKVYAELIIHVIIPSIQPDDKLLCIEQPKIIPVDLRNCCARYPCECPTTLKVLELLEMYPP